MPETIPSKKAALPIKELPLKVFFLLIIACGLLIVLVGSKAGYGAAAAAILVIPSIVISIYFPTVLLSSSVLGGTNFYRVFMSLGGLESGYVLYSLLGFSALIGGAIILIKRKSFTFRLNTPNILLILILAIALLGLLHSKNISYGILKTGTFFVGSFIPYFAIQTLGGDLTRIKKLFIIGLILMTVPFLFSSGTLLLGGIPKWERFTTAGAGPISFSRGFALAVLLSFLLIEIAIKTWQKVLLILFALMNAAIMVIVATRGPVIALALALLIYIIFLSKLDLWKRVLISVFLALFTVAVATKVSTFLLLRMTSLKGAEMSAMGRVMLWKASLEHLLDAPFIGLGTGSFSSILSSYGKSTGLVYPHNIWLEYYLEWGIIGIILVLSFIVSLGIRSVRMLRSSLISQEHNKLLRIAITLVLFSLANAQVSGSLAGNRFLYISTGLLLTLTYKTPESRKK
ncbi:hypothetical protein DRQ36_03275 [bacterium]|nr:MAG: hypothetical protein DRQ36_03275 [bacterium]